MNPPARTAFFWNKTSTPRACFPPQRPQPVRRLRQLAPLAPLAPLALILPLASALTLLPRATQAEDFQGSTHKLEYDAEPIQYTSSTPTDPVTKAQQKLKSSKNKGWLNFDPKYGYLPAVLELFNVPASSQMFVFSKTSVQRHNIHPDTPRALYFSDTLYIGYIPGAPQIGSRLLHGQPGQG